MISCLMVGASRALRVSSVLGATGFITKKGRQATNMRFRSFYDSINESESGSKKALVAVSMSCSPSDSYKALWEKFEQNKQRQRPANFYSGNPSRQILQQMNLPEKSLLISATMPSFRDAQKEETDSMVQIFLNESTIANLSDELSQTLKQWISLSERTHGKRPYE